MAPSEGQTGSQLPIMAHKMLSLPTSLCTHPSSPYFTFYWHVPSCFLALHLCELQKGSSHHSFSDDSPSWSCLSSITSLPERSPRASGLGQVPVPGLLPHAPHAPFTQVSVLCVGRSPPVTLKALLREGPRPMWLYTSRTQQRTLSKCL